MIIADVIFLFCKDLHQTFPKDCKQTTGQSKPAFLQVYSGVLVTKVIDFQVVSNSVLDGTQRKVIKISSSSILVPHL